MYCDYVRGRSLERNCIPVLRPRLPGTDTLVPYLREIERARVYTNHGPLFFRFAAKLARCLGQPAGSVVPSSSGTDALIGAVLATVPAGRPERTLALVPSFTFVATAVAAERCGLRPLIADVDPQTWMLDPEALVDHPRLAEIAVVIPVAPFGRPVPQAPWRRFSAITGIPVVIDTAASFATIESDPAPYLGAIPTAMSFHATKSFGIGEGGCVVCDDTTTSAAVACALNFGFFGSRDSVAASLNGKMSEFQAAIGLAALDEWPARRLALERIVLAYRAGLRDGSDAFRLHAMPDIDGSTIQLECRSGWIAREIAATLADGGIDTRFWYGGGLVGHAHFGSCRAGPTIVSDDLCRRLIGLPCYVDLDEGDIELVCRLVHAAMMACDARVD